METFIIVGDILSICVFFNLRGFTNDTFIQSYEKVT